MQASKLLSGVGIATELSVAEFVNARHQNLPHPTSRAGDNETDRGSQWRSCGKAEPCDPRPEDEC